MAKNKNNKREKQNGAAMSEKETAATGTAAETTNDAAAAEKPADPAKAETGAAGIVAENEPSQDGQNNAADEGSVTLSKAEFEEAKARIAEMNARIEQLEKERDSAIDDARRTLAEFSNYKRRNNSIREESYDDGVRETIKNVLPVLDNFERAFANAEDTPFVQGMRLIEKQLLDCLRKSGVEEIEAEGQFDPSLHNAVMQDTESDCESGTITAVLQKGYRLKGKIIRHTLVRVKV